MARVANPHLRVSSVSETVRGYVRLSAVFLRVQNVPPKAGTGNDFHITNTTATALANSRRSANVRTTRSLERRILQ